MSLRNKGFSIFWASVLSFGMSMVSLYAANGTWNGTVNTAWTNSGNWSAAYPGTAAGETATFNNAGGASDIIDLAGLVSIKNITFDAVACAAYAIGTSSLQTLVFENGGKIMLGVATNNNQEVKASLQLGNANGNASYYLENNNPLKALTLSGNSAPFGTGNKTLYLQGSSGTGVVSGAISGTFTGANALYKNGAGTWKLTGNNTFAGNVEVNYGPIIITQSAGLGSVTGSKTIRLTNGTTGNPQLHLDGSAGNIILPVGMNFITSNQRTGAGAIQSFAGNNTINGNFTLSGGGGDTAITAYQGKLTFTGNFAPDQSGRNLQLGGNGDGAITGVISGNGANLLNVRKNNGLGTWTLSGANTFSGNAEVSAGKLVITGLNGKVGGGAAVYNTAILDVINTFSENHYNRISDTNVLQMSGGTFRWLNNGGNIDYSETIGTLSITSGVNTIVTSQAALGKLSTLIFSNGLLYTSGSLNFQGVGLGDSDRNRIYLIGQAEGLIGAWATVNGTNYAAYSSTRGVYASTEVVTTTSIAARGPSSVIPNNAYSTAEITTPGDTGPILLAASDTTVNGVVQKTDTAAVVATAAQTLRTSLIGIDAGKTDLTIGENAQDGFLTAAGAVGGTLVLSNANAAASLTVNASLVNNAALIAVVKAGPGDVSLKGLNTVTGSLNIDGGTVIFDGITQTNTLAISGSGAIEKRGVSTLTLTGVNSFTGGVTVTQGTLEAKAANALGQGPVVNNATIDLTVGGATTYSGLDNKSFSGNGTFNVKLGTGGDNTALRGNGSAFTGTWNIGAGAAASSGKAQLDGLDHAAATKNVFTNATLYCATANTYYAPVNLHGGNTGESYGQLRLDGNATWAGPVNIKAGITNAADALLGAHNSAGFITGVIDDAGAKIVVDKGGGSTLTLSGTNTYSGPTHVKQGTLQVAAFGSIGAMNSPLGAQADANDGRIMLGGPEGGRIQYSGTGETSDRPIQLAGNAGKNSHIKNVGTGTLTLTGGISSLNAANGRRLQLEGSASGTGIVDCVISDFDATVSNDVFKTELGTWIFKQSNTFKGPVLVQQGYLRITKSDGFGVGPKTVSLVPDANTTRYATLELDGSDGDLTLASNIRFVVSSIHFGGAFNNLAGTNTIQGNICPDSGDVEAALNVSAGKLIVTGNIFATIAGRGLRFWGNSDGEVSGVISNGATAALPLWKEWGTGTWQLSGNNTYSGITKISAGKLVVGGASGRIATGAGIVINGGTLEIDDTVVGGGDRIADGSAVTMSGGGLRYKHAGIADQIYSETVGALTLVGGINTISSDQAAADVSSTFTLSSLTRTAGLVNFEGVGLGDISNARNRIKINGLPDGLIGTWATVNGTAYAAYDSVRGVYAADGTMVASIAARGPQEILDDPTTNAVINADGTEGPITLAGATTSSVKGLVQDHTMDATVAMTNKNFRVNDLVINSGKSALTIGTDRNEGTVAPVTASTSLVVINNSSSELTINAPVVNNGTTKVEKLGSGTVTLGGTNSYTGATMIQEGTLELNTPANHTFTSTITNNAQLRLAGVSATVTQTISAIISGAGVITKSADSVVRLNAANTFTGPLTNSAGTIIADNNAALGTIAGPTVINGTGTLEVNGKNLGSEPVFAEGMGVDSLGAFNNSGAAQQNAFKFLTLTGDSASGGTNRFDIRGGGAVLDMGGHKLTQLNTYGFYIVATAVTNTGNFDVQKGALTYETSSTTDGSAANTLTLRSGTTFGMYQTVAPVPWTMLAEDGSTVRGNSNNAQNQNNWAGPLFFEGLTYLAGGGELRISGQISDAPAKTGSIVKNDAQTCYLTHTNNIYTGTTVISNGTLQAQFAGSLPGYNSDKVTVVPGAVLQVVVATNGVETGWTSEQIQAISASSFALSNCWLSMVCPADYYYPYNFPQNPSGRGFRKLGAGVMTLPENQTILGGLYVQGGELVLSNLLWETGQITTEIAWLAGESAKMTLAGNAMLKCYLPPYNVGGNALVVGRKGRGILDLKDEAVTTNKLYVGGDAGSVGAVYQTGNSTFMNWGGANNEWRMGASGDGYYHLMSGTWTNHGLGQIGERGRGYVLQTGGLYAQGTAYGGYLGVSRGGTGVVHTVGGKFFSATEVRLCDQSGGANGIGVFTADDNADVTIMGNVNMSDATGSMAVMNLNGGVVEANLFQKVNARTGSRGYVNFDGGTLKSRVNGSLFGTGAGAPTAVNIYDEGATFDTAGFSSTVPVPLQTPAGYGVSSLTLTASGSGYIGAPVVVITGGSGDGATAIAEFDRASGTVTGVKLTNPGVGYLSNPTVTIAGGGGSGATATALVAMNSSGGLTKNGSGTLVLAATNTYAGPTTIANGQVTVASDQGIPLGTDIAITGGILDLAGNTVTGGVLTITSGTLQDGTLSATDYNISDNVTIAATLQGNANLLKTGTGVTKIAPMSYTGVTSVEEGTLELSPASLPLLSHRWSFNNSVNDSVGGAHAILSGTATMGANDVSLPGGTRGTAAVQLPNMILPATNAAVTLELWATQVGVRNWGRILDFGTPGTTNYLEMSWSNGTDINKERVDIKWAGGTSSADNTLAPFTLGVAYHISLVVRPVENGAGSVVAWYKKDASTGATLKSGRYTTTWTLAQLGQTDMWLGRSKFAPDNDAQCLFNEVRIWEGALSEAQLAANVLAGPDALPTGTVTTALPDAVVAADAALDLGGGSYTLANLSGLGMVTNGTLTITGTVAPAGTGIGDLTLACTVDLNGTLQVNVGASTIDRLLVNGTLDLQDATLTVANPSALVGRAWTIIESTGSITGNIYWPLANRPDANWGVIRVGNSVKLALTGTRISFQ